MDNNDIKTAVGIGQSLIEKTSFYEDALRGGAKELGKSLETAGKAVNICLSPIGVIVWGYELVKDYIVEKVSKKLSGLPPEQIQTPRANIAVPAIEGIRITHDEPSLQELFANLIASSMNKQTALGVLPSFVKVISEITPDEAKIISFLFARNICPIINLNKVNKNTGGFHLIVSHFTNITKKINCEFPTMTPAYLENLERLKIIEIREDLYFKDENAYKELYDDEMLTPFIKEIDMEDPSLKKFDKGMARLTTYGVAFCKACGIQTIEQFSPLKNLKNSAED